MEFRNFFLASLDPADSAVLVPHLREVSLSRGEVLFEPDAPVETLYFPGSACVSVVRVLQEGREVETITVGRETVVALLDAAGGEVSHSRIFAQIAGSAMVLPAGPFRARLRESQTLLRLMLLHGRANAHQAELGVACNAAHAAPGRMARWLLMTQDRTGSRSFPLTQDYLAVMTGVQRSTVSQLAADLKRDKVISYARGAMTILDRDRLISRACECYAEMESVFKELAARK